MMGLFQGTGAMRGCLSLFDTKLTARGYMLIFHNPTSMSLYESFNITSQIVSEVGGYSKPTCYLLPDFQPEQMDSGPLLNIINGKANFNFPPFYKKTPFVAEYFIVLLKSL